MFRSRFINNISSIIRELCQLKFSDGKPSMKQIMSALKDIEIIKLNVKNFGYQIGHMLRPYLEAIDISGQPEIWNLESKATTQQDIESPWFRYWCNELKIAPIYHRKLWEFAFLLQCLYENGKLSSDLRGIGFGCGEEPMASYFASKGINVLVTDLEPEKVKGAGWVETSQHASSLENIYHPHICSRDQFDQYVNHAFVDMNFMPDKYDGQYDFCWSICAMEHLGSIEKGLTFVENSLKMLKPGGIAVHTTEYNYLSENITIDNWPSVLFLKKHFESLAKRISESGHEFIGPSFDTGNGYLDRFIDIPPYSLGEGRLRKEIWSNYNQVSHLKLSVDGYACTCFGILIKKIK
jgi:2-polyprenyl-3-methyl-5-hydroxy-6-metoxy-1,4-benzoquinol methylase